MARAMDAHELSALEHANWIAYLTGVVQCTGAAPVRRHGGVVAISSDIPFDWFNQVLIERPDAASEDLLAALKKARGGGRSFVVRLREGVDDRFIAMLTVAVRYIAYRPSGRLD